MEDETEWANGRRRISETVASGVLIGFIDGGWVERGKVGEVVSWGIRVR
jgi:hypothetical protein